MRFTVLASLLMTLGVFCGCTAPDPVVFSEALQQKVDEKVYLKTNIWYTNPAAISCLNIQDGRFLPVGSEVEPVMTTDEGQIIFKDTDGKIYTILFSEGETLSSMREYVKRVFTTTPPEEFFKDTDANALARIRRGEVVAGMNRQDVLFAYGYPPAVRTPDLRNESWIYWIGGNRTIRVVFRGDTVTKVVEF